MIHDQIHIEFLVYRYFRHKIYDIIEIKRLYKFYTKGAKGRAGQNAHPLGQYAQPRYIAHHIDNS